MKKYFFLDEEASLLSELIKLADIYCSIQFEWTNTQIMDTLFDKILTQKDASLYNALANYFVKKSEKVNKLCLELGTNDNSKSKVHHHSNMQELIMNDNSHLIILHEQMNEIKVKIISFSLILCTEPTT